MLPPAGHVLLVAGGGAVGAIARVGLAEAVPVLPGAVPWTTAAENVSGAFALAVAITLLADRARDRPGLRLAVGTGALGAFTTYSTLAVEVNARLADDHLVLGIAYGLGSVTVGLLAALAGRATARRWTRRRAGGRRS